MTGATTVNGYVEGQIVVCTATFEDLTGALVDPTTTYFKYYVSATPVLPSTLSPTSFSWMLGGPTTPSPAVLARISQGLYQIQLDTTGLPGFWFYRFSSTGTGQTINPMGYFYVQPSAF